MQYAILTGLQNITKSCHPNNPNTLKKGLSNLYKNNLNKLIFYVIKLN